MEMETVKLSTIVNEFKPEFYPFLQQSELDSIIVLRDGLNVLAPQDAIEIIQCRIYEQQKNALLQ